MKILFIVTSYWAIGEMEIAVQFAKGLANPQDVLFWVPRKHENYVKTKGFQTVSLYFNMAKLNKIMLKNIQNSFTPDFVVLSDYLNYVFCEKHYGLTLDDLDYFTGTIGGFDLYNQVENPRRMDTYGFQSKLTMFDERIKFILHPCPLLDGDVTNENKNRFAVPLVDKLTLRGEEEKENAKKALGINIEQKVILITNAQWQSTYRKYERAVRFVGKAERYFQAILEELSKDYYVVVIGKENENEADSNIHYLPSVSPDTFDKYIDATDLFLSRNIISTSFAKVILKGILGIVLINSSVDEDAYRCKMFPVGWYDYIAPLESKSLYFQCFKQYEMFEQSDCIIKIKELLCEPQDQKVLKEYHEQLKKLKNAQDIFNELERKSIDGRDNDSY